MVARRAKINKSVESQSSDRALRITTKKAATNVELVQDNSRKCLNVHRAVDAESLII